MLPTVFFLLMPRRLSEGYLHLIERRWHWLMNYTDISHVYSREYEAPRTDEREDLLAC
jgi:hypothetical protein